MQTQQYQTPWRRHSSTRIRGPDTRTQQHQTPLPRHADTAAQDSPDLDTQTMQHQIFYGSDNLGCIANPLSAHTPAPNEGAAAEMEVLTLGTHFFSGVWTNKDGIHGFKVYAHASSHWAVHAYNEDIQSSFCLILALEMYATLPINVPCPMGNLTNKWNEINENVVGMKKS